MINISQGLTSSWENVWLQRGSHEEMALKQHGKGDERNSVFYR
jgi:hypothetical protein